ncbi:MAG: dTDP-4-dehydrorhamnose reductase [Elusimicrobia bacterium]|nr:dTDP-4-dehydrorhamnose reductase [Elusimicrobiota bacterium]
MNGGGENLKTRISIAITKISIKLKIKKINMKILITGISGLLGSELAKVLKDKHEICGIARNFNSPEFKTYNIDITDSKLTYDTISKINPDAVIHAATYSNVDECEKNPELAFKINSLGTRNVCLACQRFDTVLVYISTDYVFSGKDFPKEGYTELDIPNPVNIYAKSKLAGEWFVKNLLNKFFIIRTSWLFGSKRNNFVSAIFDDLKNNKNVKQAGDMRSSPTNVFDLSLAISKLLETNLYGIYHLTNSGFASRYEVAVYIAKILGCSKNKIEKVSLKSFNFAAPRPYFSGLKNYIWKLNDFKPLKPWQESVADFLSAKI